MEVLFVVKYQTKTDRNKRIKLTVMPFVPLYHQIMVM